MDDTLFICYYASKQGVKYRALVKNNDIDEQDIQEEYEVEPP